MKEGLEGSNSCWGSSEDGGSELEEKGMKWRRRVELEKKGGMRFYKTEKRLGTKALGGRIGIGRPNDQLEAITTCHMTVQRRWEHGSKGSTRAQGCLGPEMKFKPDKAHVQRHLGNPKAQTRREHKGIEGTQGRTTKKETLYLKHSSDARALG